PGQGPPHPQALGPRPRPRRRRPAHALAPQPLSRLHDPCVEQTTPPGRSNPADRRRALTNAASADRLARGLATTPRMAQRRRTAKGRRSGPGRGLAGIKVTDDNNPQATSNGADPQDPQNRPHAPESAAPPVRATHPDLSVRPFRGLG